MDRRHFLRSSLCAAIGASASPFIFNSKQIHAQARNTRAPYDLIIRDGRSMAAEPALEIGTGPIFQGKMDLSLFPSRE